MRLVGTKFVPTLRSFSHTRHSGESWKPERTGMRSILNFDPSDRVYILDSGVRRNDDVGVETGVRDATVLNALLRVQYCTGAVTHKFRTIIKQIGSLPCAPFARGKESNCGIFFMYRNLGVAALALHANEVIE